MPFSIKQDGESWKVMNDETGDIKGEHASEEEAKDQLSALYANVPEASEKMVKVTHYQANVLVKADWDETKHKRDESGRFGAGPGGEGSVLTPKKASEKDGAMLTTVPNMQGLSLKPGDEFTFPNGEKGEVLQTVSAGKTLVRPKSVPKSESGDLTEDDDPMHGEGSSSPQKERAKRKQAKEKWRASKDADHYESLKQFFFDDGEYEDYDLGSLEDLESEQSDNMDDDLQEAIDGARRHLIRQGAQPVDDTEATERAKEKIMQADPQDRFMSEAKGEGQIGPSDWKEPPMPPKDEGNKPSYMRQPSKTTGDDFWSQAKKYHFPAGTMAAPALLKGANMDSTEFTVFLPITKVDEEKRQVWGWGAKEEVDSVNEVMDYATAKPEFEEWVNQAQKRSGGKSQGNVRAMHQPKAAGKLISFQADDMNKGFYVGAEIVDNDDWEKVQKGVYTGFSVGGSYKRRWVDPQFPGAIRYTPKPTELSLVDSPAITSATFQLVKGTDISEVPFRLGSEGSVIELIRAPKLAKQTITGVPAAPEAIANMPLGTTATEGGPSTIQRMPDPSTPMEITPGKNVSVPSQDALAVHAVNSQDLDAAMNQIIGSVSSVVKAAVQEALADLQKKSTSAPAERMIPVKAAAKISIRKEKHNA